MQNPYLQGQAQAITNQVNQNLQTQQLPGINTNAIAAGGFGGSRHGIAQGLAIGNTNQGLSNSLANLYGNAYAQDQQIAAQSSMQAAQIAAQERIAAMNDKTQRDLGFGGLDYNYWNAGNQFGMQNKSLDQNFYTANRGQDLQQMSLGANLVNQGNLGLSTAGQGMYGLGQQQQQQSWLPYQQFGGLLGQFSGLGQQQSQTQPGGSTLGNVMGGAFTAAQIWQLMNKTGG